MSAVYLLLFTCKCLTELCTLYKYKPVTKGFVLKGISIDSMVNTVDFHSFLLEFIKRSVHGMIRNIVTCPLL